MRGGARLYINRSIATKGKLNIERLNIKSLAIKRLWLIKENQISQVKEFSAFLCMGRCKSLGSLKSFLWYASQLSGAYILVSTSWVFSGLTVGSGCSLLASRWQVILCFLPEFPQGSPGHLWWSEVAAVFDDFDILCLLIWHPLFTDGIKGISMQFSIKWYYSG